MWKDYFLVDVVSQQKNRFSTLSKFDFFRYGKVETYNILQQYYIYVCSFTYNNTCCKQFISNL